MITILYKWMFVFLLAPILLRNKIGQQKPKHKALKIPFYKELSKIDSVGKGKVVSRVTFLKILIWAIWIGIVVAASRPQIVGEKVLIDQDARITVLVLDSSGSMQERDFVIDNRPAQRFDVMKSIVTEFIEERKGDKIGIVLFGTYAYVYAPPTDDTKTLLYLLETAQLGLVGGNTAIGDGLGMAIKMTENFPKENRVAILLSDGASNAGTLRDDEALALAKQAGLKVYTISMGGSTKSKNFFGFSLTQLAPTNTAILKKIADETGGKFYKAENTKELQRIYEDINKQEPIKDESKYYRPTKEIFYIPLCISFIISIWLFISITREAKNAR